MNLPDNKLVSQYKDLIREQDIQIQRLNQANDLLTKEKQEFEVASKCIKKKNKFIEYIFEYFLIYIVIGTSTRTSINR